MAKKDLGIVTFMPWTNLYPFFTTKVTNFSGDGGYHIQDNKCFILMNGVCSSALSLPTPSTPFDLSYIKNGEAIIQNNFNGTLSTSNGDIIHLEVVYEV